VFVQKTPQGRYNCRRRRSRIFRFPLYPIRARMWASLGCTTCGTQCDLCVRSPLIEERIQAEQSKPALVERTFDF